MQEKVNEWTFPLKKHRFTEELVFWRFLTFSVVTVLRLRQAPREFIDTLVLFWWCCYRAKAGFAAITTHTCDSPVVTIAFVVFFFSFYSPSEMQYSLHKWTKTDVELWWRRQSALVRTSAFFGVSCLCAKAVGYSNVSNCLACQINLRQVLLLEIRYFLDYMY